MQMRKEEKETETEHVHSGSIHSYNPSIQNVCRETGCSVQ